MSQMCSREGRLDILLEQLKGFSIIAKELDIIILEMSVLLDPQKFV